MNCDLTIEILPWLLNGTLGEDERREALDHLKSCEACRQALGETRLAWRIYDQHIPAAALVAHAGGDAPEGVDAEVLAAHLAVCPQCTAELELARLSRGLVEDESVALLGAARTAARATPRAVPARWRTTALAAGLAGLVAFGGWYRSAEEARALSGRLASAEVPPAPAPAVGAPAAAGTADPQRIADQQHQLEAMQKTVEDIQKAEGKAREQLAQLAERSPLEPQVNTWVGDVRPLGDVVRGGDAGTVEIPAGATATLLLSAAASIPGDRDVEIADAQGRIVWQGRGLHLNAESRDYTLTLPRGALPAGTYTIHLYRTVDGSRAPAESYTFAVR